VSASNSTIKETYTITQADIDAGKVVNTLWLRRKIPKNNSVTDISGTTVTNDTPTDTPLTQTPRSCETAAVGGTGKVDVITILCSNQYREHYPYECNRNRPNGRFNDH
jgi:hypothetical protein